MNAYTLQWNCISLLFTKEIEVLLPISFHFLFFDIIWHECNKNGEVLRNDMNKAITWTETTFLPGKEMILCKVIDREKTKTKPQLCLCKDNDEITCEMSSLRSCILVRCERFYMHTEK